MDDDKQTHTFQLVGAEIDSFNKAFEMSGFRSKSEFIRFLLFSGIKEIYAEDQQ